jgi:hypothetical protein
MAFSIQTAQTKTKLPQWFHTTIATPTVAILDSIFHFQVNHCEVDILVAIECSDVSILGVILTLVIQYRWLLERYVWMSFTQSIFNGSTYPS